MAAIPKRAMQLEAYLKGREVSVFAGEMDAKLATDIATCLSQDFDPIDDMRASRSYRLLAAAQLVQKMFIEYQSGYMRLSKPQHFRTPEDFTATVQA
jgi:xanthine dehydrogenase small subunit